MKLTRQHVPFTQVANEVLNSPNLSAKAKGIYAYLYSKPEGWRFSSWRIHNDFKDGRRSIMTGLQELEDAHLLQRTRNADGTMDYHLLYKGLKKVESEGEPVVPEPRIERKSLSAETAPRGESLSAKTAQCQNRTVLKPHSAKTAPVYSKTLDQVILSNKKKEGEKEERSLFSFESFFQEYEKPFNQDESKLEWMKLNGKDREAAMAFIEAYKLYEPDPKFRKHPNNYLSGRFWEREGKAILDSLTKKTPKTVYYSYQQMIDLVTATGDITTSDFELVQHPTLAERMWVRKEPQNHYGEVSNG